MSAYHHSSAMRAVSPPFAFAGQRAIGVASLQAMALGSTGVWACDPTRAKSLRPRRDTKWEGDSKAEVNGS